MTEIAALARALFPVPKIKGEKQADFNNMKISSSRCLVIFQDCIQSLLLVTDVIKNN